SGLPGRLKVKRRAISAERHSRGSPRDRVNAYVSLQNFRADGERVEGGDLKRSIPVDVQNAFHDIANRVDLRVRCVGQGEFLVRKVSQPRSRVGAPAGVPVQGFAGKFES